MLVSPQNSKILSSWVNACFQIVYALQHVQSVSNSVSHKFVCQIIHYSCFVIFPQVFVIPPSRIEFVESIVEAEVGTILQLPLALYGRLGTYKHIRTNHQ
jgi:hypothetical protein